MRHMRTKHCGEPIRLVSLEPWPWLPPERLSLAQAAALQRETRRWDGDLSRRRRDAVEAITGGRSVIVTGWAPAPAGAAEPLRLRITPGLALIDGEPVRLPADILSPRAPVRSGYTFVLTCQLDWQPDRAVDPVGLALTERATGWLSWQGTEVRSHQVELCRVVWRADDTEPKLVLGGRLGPGATVEVQHRPRLAPALDAAVADLIRLTGRAQQARARRRAAKDARLRRLEGLLGQ